MNATFQTGGTFVARATPLPDPDTAALLRRLNAAGAPELAQKTPQEVRAWMQAMVLDTALADPPPVAELREFRLPVEGATIGARLYRPEGDGPLPLLVYFHAGGYVFGDLDTLDGFCRIMAHHAGCLVLSVDYRLAPEHRFPLPLEDCYQATLWVTGNAAELGADPARIAVGGDSSGGTMATVVCHLAHQRGGPAICHQFLWYPGVGSLGPTESVEAYARGYFLENDLMIWSMRNYLASPDDMTDPRVQPIRIADLSHMPPTFLMTAGFDPRRDDNQLYAEKLHAAGVPVVFDCVESTVHGFLFMLGAIGPAREAALRSAAHARAVFAGMEQV